MSDTTATSNAPPQTKQSFLAAMEVDTRMIGMICALLVIWFGFHILSGGTFLTPRNLWNLSVQTSSIAVMSTGMVLVIVTRHIDLSVGSVLGFIGMIMAVTQVDFLPQVLGLDHGATWIITLLVGAVLGAAIGALHGAVIAYLAVPAFIVTLGGLLVWRGAAWWVTSGQTKAPMDSTFRLIGGGIEGAIGDTASWVLAVVACVAICWATVHARRQRKRFQFPLKPMWAEYATAGIASFVVLGVIWVMNSYYLPKRVAAKLAEAKGLEVPEGGLEIARGLPIPVLIAIAVGIIMTFIATRTRFGRYVFAIGGNPEAALLSGINTKKVTVMIFSLMGILCAIGASISTARLNAATNSQGMLDELYVIAAAVIGGTSLGGGAGTVIGAMIGALVMQSLQSGMVLLGLDAPLQNIVVGIVLVAAVFIDTVYRKRSA
ncbi:MAG: sugar ABC transporter permease [Stappiaceae bacterium]